MKKYLKIFVIILIVIIILFLILSKINSKPKYTFEDVSQIITSKVSNNMYLKEENTMGSIVETFAKDQMFYKKFFIDGKLVQELLIDTENKKQINIDYTTKEIKYYENGSDVETIFSESLNSYYNDIIDENAKKTYKYLGEENSNEKNYIKFSFIVEDKFVGMQDKVKVIYYLNLDNHQIEKIEYYNMYENRAKLDSISEIAYDYGNVTDEDILKFDPNNYQDFKIENN